MKWFPFAEVVTDATSKFRKIKASDYQSEGQYKIIDQGKDAIAGYTNDESLINSDLLPIIIFGDHTRALKYEDTPIALGADGTKALKVDSRIANALYVYYYLRSITLKDAGYSRHFKFLKEIAIPIPLKDGAPNLDDQIRIAHLLGKVEGLIARRKQHLQQLDDLLRSVFLEMFGDPVRNEKGWETLPFDKVVSQDCPLTYGIVQPGDEFAGGVPIVRPVDLKTDVIHLSGLKRIDPIIDNQFRRTRLKGGEILLCVRGTTGDLAVAGDDLLNANVTRGITPIWFEKNVSTKFMLHQLRSESLQRKISEKTYGVALKQINLADVRKLKVIIPDIDIQNKFSNIADKIEGIKTRYQHSLTQLATLYGALSQQAFKGELDLSRVPLPDIKPEEEKAVVTAPVQASAEESLAISLPDTDNLLDALKNAEARKALIALWLEAYCGQLGNTPFSVQHFMAAAQTRLAELHPDNDFELGANDYEHIKSWVFAALEQGRLTQIYDDANNRAQLNASSL